MPFDKDYRSLFSTCCYLMGASATVLGAEALSYAETEIFVASCAMAVLSFTAGIATKRVSSLIITDLYFFLWMTYCTLVLYRSDGIIGPTTSLFEPMPVLALALLPRRRAIAWTAVVILLLAVLAASNTAKELREIDPNIQWPSTFVSWTCAALALSTNFAVGSLYLRQLRATTSQQNRMTQQLQLSEKFAALGELAGGVAHEVKNPLALITLRVDQARRLLDKTPPDIDRVQSFLAEVLETSRQINDVITGLNQMTRQSKADEASPIFVQTIVNSVVGLCRDKLDRHGVRLDVATLSADATVFARSGQVMQVLVNLVQNACDAAALSPEKWVSIEFRQDSAQGVFIVRDSGAGVPLALQGTIFEPFFTTKPAGHGTGLGLSISRKLAVANGGTLQLGTPTNSNSSISTFILTLPRRQPKTGIDVEEKVA